MKRENANKVTKIINKLNDYESKYKRLKECSYKDEFYVYYRGIESFNLLEEEVDILIDYYDNKIKELNK